MNRGGLASFRYGSDNQRYFQSATAPATTTVYIDKLYERINAATHKFYLGDYAIVQFGGTAPGVRYLHRDRLGSVVAITNEGGEETSGTGRLFDAFGKARNPDMSNSGGLLNGTTETTRGFTQHEHLNNVQLIHMNGRAYDYNLGRFLSVDPFIQFPENSQSLNPYTYLMNNPMAGTDPSGYAFDCSKSNCDVISFNRPQTQQQRDNLKKRFDASQNNGKSGSPTTTPAGSSAEKINAPGTGPSERNADTYAYGPWPPTSETETLFNFQRYAGGMVQEFEPMPLLVNVAIAATIALIGGHNPFTGENAPGDDSIEGGAFSPVGIFKAGATAAGSLILRSRAAAGAVRAIPGLSDDIARTFAGARYQARVLQQDVVAYRYSGGISAAQGQFLTTSQTVGQIGSPAAAQRALNLPANATAERLNAFVIPRGTTIYYGRVAGGGERATQIFIHDKSVLRSLP